MDAPHQSASAHAPGGARRARLPAQRIDAPARAHVDQRAVLALALPLMANSAVQIVLNLTDMWFMGRISTKALAAVGAVQWLIMVVGAGARRRGHGGADPRRAELRRASLQARRPRRCGPRSGAWRAPRRCSSLVGAARHLILAPVRLRRPDRAAWPRPSGSRASAAPSSARRCGPCSGFFNGIGRPRITLWITLVTTLANALLNQVFIFGLGWGIAGSAWATNCAQVIGLLFALAIFLRPHYRRAYHSHLTWRPHARRLVRAAAPRRADGTVTRRGPARASPSSR